MAEQDNSSPEAQKKAEIDKLKEQLMVAYEKERYEGTRIALIDRDSDLLNNTRSLLELKGAKVDTYPDMDAAMAAINAPGALKPHVIVADQKVSPPSGISAIQYTGDISQRFGEDVVLKGSSIGELLALIDKKLGRGRGTA